MPARTARRLTLSPTTQASVRRFDDRVDRAFDHLRGNPVADRVFYGASALGDHSLIWVMLAAARGLRSGSSDGGLHLRAAVRAVAGLGVESALVNQGIKNLFRRSRPLATTPRPLSLRKPRSSSFPSGHATSAFCAAGLLADGDPAFAPAYYAIATIVAASRIHVRIHHASDVVAGIPIGIALGWVGRRLHPLPPVRRSS